jgi:hypothetical protein
MSQSNGSAIGVQGCRCTWTDSESENATEKTNHRGKFWYLISVNNRCTVHSATAPPPHTKRRR